MESQREKPQFDINALKGEVMFLETVVMALIRSLPIGAQAEFLRIWEEESEVARVTMLNSTTPEAMLQAFETSVASLRAIRY